MLKGMMLVLGVYGGVVGGIVLEIFGGFIFSSDNWSEGFLFVLWGVLFGWSKSAFSIRLFTDMSGLKLLAVLRFWFDIRWMDGLLFSFRGDNQSFP